jgi:uncharacterized protein (UPF0305 family)
MTDTSTIDANALFLELKREAESIPQALIPKTPEHGVDAGNVSQVMSDYDLEIFREILRKDRVEADHRIDRKTLDDFTSKIDRYMDEQAPGQDQLKRYICIISTYLVFIAKRPLHSPGLAFFGDSKIVKKNDTYYCPAKSVYIKDKDSLCKYCVCKSKRRDDNKK